MNLNNNKLIGIYKENSDYDHFGIFLNYIIKEFIEINYYIKNAIEQFTLKTDKKILGKGNYGKVYLIEYNNKKYALKKIPIISFNDEEEDLAKYENEVEFLSNLRNDNIIRYYESFKDKDYFYIIMEYGGNYNLDDFIKKYKNKNQLIPEDILTNIVYQIYLGLKEIHKSKIIHRDLKPENIFINENYEIKIGDFGISKLLKTNQKYTKTNAGTDEYKAPEIFKGIKYTNKVDIYSLGCIIYELCSRTRFFNDKNDYKNIPEEYGNKWQELIDLCTIEDYNRRLKIEEIYEFINNEINEILLTVKVNKTNIGKKIYFLNNDEKNHLIRMTNKNNSLDNLNESNTILYIDNIRYKFEKYFIPKTEGIYTIKLKIFCNIKDTSYMFFGCDDIESIDLSLFDSKNVTNMDDMFSGCKNLKSINLSSFYLGKVLFDLTFNLKEIKININILEKFIMYHNKFQDIIKINDL